MFEKKSAYPSSDRNEAQRTAGHKSRGDDNGRLRYYGGRAFSYESWLNIPTFMRQGKTLRYS